jgi:signal transduction histidine kinase
MERRPTESPSSAHGRGARRAECLRRADSVSKLGVELQLAVHDLRNLLGNASLNASLLANKLSKETLAAEHHELLDSVRRDLRSVQDELHRVTQLAEDQTPAVETIDVVEFRSDVRRLACTAAHQMNDVRVSVDVPEQPLLVRGRRSHLLQAVFALVRNAIEASQPSNEVRVEVEAHGEEVHLRVRDHGPGLPLELHERVFEGVESAKPTGLGLGLVVARRIVAEHAGSMKLSPAPGGGLCAEIRLTTTRPESDA